MPVRMRGEDEMIRNLRFVRQRFPERTAAAIYAEMEIDATEMKRRTPVDTRPNAPHPGQLRNSIHVEQPTIRGKTIEVTVATGAEAPYAIYVHENPDAYHPIGQWKFMESVIRESRPHMAERIGRRIHLGRGKQRGAF